MADRRESESVETVAMSEHLWQDRETWYIVGRLIKEAARGASEHRAPVPVERPPVGALVVEATHAWHHRGPNWPTREAVGWVERVEAEDDSKPLDDFNVRVVLRLLDPGEGEPLQPWVNANFYVAPVHPREREPHA